MQDFPIKSLMLGLIGAVVGGVAGGFICQLLAGQGLYGVMIPGALVGLGFSMAAKRRHVLFGVICAVLGLLACLLTEWLVYSNNDSFFSLLIELKDDHVITWIMLGLGAVLGYSLGVGRESAIRDYKR